MSTSAGTGYETANDSRYFRDVLGNVPTAVVAVTAMDESGQPTGMTVGSFTSVSLDPPLVAFMPAKTSSTMPKIRDAGRFCANILTADQEDVCSQLALKGGDKFARLRWEESPHGTPHIAGAIGWIDCTITDVHDAGDHYIVVASVESLRADHRASPLIFLRGGYGRFASTSLSAPAEADLYHPLRIVDQAWPAMQRVSNELGVECLASSVISDRLVLVGSSQAGGIASPFYMRLGQRMPFQPPLAIPLIAWRDPADIERWISRSGDHLDQVRLSSMVQRVHDRGWSVVLRSPEQVRFERAVADMPVYEATLEHGTEVAAAAAALQLANYEPDEIDPDASYSVRIITVPVLDNHGDVHVALSLYQLPREMTGTELIKYADRLVAASEEVTAVLGAASPPSRA